MTMKEIALKAARALEDKKGLRVRLLEVTEVTTLAEYFLICTGTSNTHVNTLCDAVEEAVDGCGEPLLHREGHRGGTWVLLDYGCIAVHVFNAEAREFYSLEHLWADGKEIDLTDVLKAD